MRLEAHVDVARARLRRATVTRSIASKLDGGKTYLIVEPLGRPRLWRLSTDAVVEGFTDGLAKAGALAGLARLRTAVTAARTLLVQRCESLIERELPDVAILAMLLDGGELHVHSVGPCRAYLNRRRHTERITTRDEDASGLLESTPTETRVSLEPDDLVLAGSLSAFSSASVSLVATVLERDPSTAGSVIAQLLTEPAEQSGSGAAVIVARAR